MGVRNYCTYFDWNYLAQGLALYESMERCCQPYHLWILALCGQTSQRLSDLKLPNVTVVHMADFETDELRAVRPTRDWREYIWTTTGGWMLYVLDRANHVSYVDADCQFFERPLTLYEEIEGVNIAITPHRYSPVYQHFAGLVGIYNVGLIYATRQGVGCLRHWYRQCLNECRFRTGDQKYLDDWPQRWGAHPIRHKGVDLAPWNQIQYSYTVQDNHMWVDGEPLLLYHFHGGLDGGGYPLAPLVEQFVYGERHRVLEQVREKYF